jgi:MFS family permease
MPSRHPFHSVLFAASFFMSLASGMVNYSLIFYVRDLFGVDKTAVGFISSGLTLAYFLGILGFLAWKKPHPRFVLWLASWAMAACVAVYLLIPNWTVTFVFHALFGLAMALFWPRIMGWLSWGVEGRDLGRTMGRFNFSWAFGGILAPWLGGLLVEADPRWPFLTAIALLATVGLLMPLGARLFSGMKAHQGRSDVVETTDSESQGPTPLRHPARLGVAGAYFLTGALLFIFPAFAKESLGFSESLTGSFLLVRMLAATIGFEIWGRWTFWHFKFPPVAIGMVVLLGLILLFPLGTAPWQFYLLFAGVGLVFSILYSYALFHGVAGSVHRERSMTIHEAVLNIGLFLGTALGGWVSDTWSMNAVFGLCAAVALALLAAQIVQNFWRKGRVA